VIPKDGLHSSATYAAASADSIHAVPSRGGRNSLQRKRVVGAAGWGRGSPLGAAAEAEVTLSRCLGAEQPDEFLEFKN